MGSVMYIHVTYIHTVCPVPHRRAMMVCTTLYCNADIAFVLWPSRTADPLTRRQEWSQKKILSRRLLLQRYTRRRKRKYTDEFRRGQEQRRRSKINIEMNENLDAHEGGQCGRVCNPTVSSSAVRSSTYTYYTVTSTRIYYTYTMTN